jgi:hypothetical protein
MTTMFAGAVSYRRAGRAIVTSKHVRWPRCFRTDRSLIEAQAATPVTTYLAGVSTG